MAKGRFTGGRSFQKGVASNPKGSVGMPKDIRDAKKLTQNEFVKIACGLVKSTKAELQTKLNDPTSTALELMIGGIIAKAITDQDHHRAEFILNRIIGRVAIQADITMTEETPTVNFGVAKKKKPVVIDV